MLQKKNVRSNFLNKILLGFSQHAWPAFHSISLGMSIVFTVAFVIVRIGRRYRREMRRKLKRLLAAKKQGDHGDRRSSSRAARSSKSRSRSSKGNSRHCKTSLSTSEHPFDSITEAMSYGQKRDSSAGFSQHQRILMPLELYFITSYFDIIFDFNL